MQILHGCIWSHVGVDCVCIVFLRCVWIYVDLDFLMNHFLSDSLCVLEANGWVHGPHTLFNMGVGTHSCMLESDTWASIIDGRGLGGEYLVCHFAKLRSSYCFIWIDMDLYIFHMDVYGVMLVLIVFALFF